MPKKVKNRFADKADKIFYSEMIDRIKLEILGTMLRTIESSRARLKGQSNYLKDFVRILMKRLSIYEHSWRQTTVQISYPMGIQKSEGENLKKKLLASYGKTAESWVIEHTETVTNYTFSPEMIDRMKAKPEFEKEIIELLGNTPRITIGQTPKRIKSGKPKK